MAITIRNSDGSFAGARTASLGTDERAIPEYLAKLEEGQYLEWTFNEISDAGYFSVTKTYRRK